MNYLHIELPSLHLFWEDLEGEDKVISVIRTNYPKPSLLQMGGIIREIANVRLVDKIGRASCRERV